MLDVRDATVLALSSTAPFYSALVTAPLVVDLVGSGAALVYVVALVPMLLVCHGMAVNDRRDPDKGTVYLWMRRLPPRWGWAGGYCLGVTGIVATSGQAYVAVEALVPAFPGWAKAVAGALLVGVAAAVSVRSVELTSWIQSAGVLLQAVATAYLVWALTSSPVTFTPVTGGVLDWVHAVLLAVFAYWGFDTVFALTEESGQRVPRTASFASLALLLFVYAVFSGAVSSPTVSAAVRHPIVVAAVAAASLLSLGSTILPTARGISAMAQRRDLPRFLAPDASGVIATAVLAAAWLVVSVLHQGFFEDSIEALSVHVGAYFVMSCVAAWRFETHGRGLHLVSAVLMGVITVATAQQTFAVDYGMTSVAGVGGVGLIVTGLAALGVVLTVSCAGPPVGG